MRHMHFYLVAVAAICCSLLQIKLKKLNFQFLLIAQLLFTQKIWTEGGQ